MFMPIIMKDHTLDILIIRKNHFITKNNSIHFLGHECKNIFFSRFYPGVSIISSNSTLWLVHIFGQQSRLWRSVVASRTAAAVSSTALAGVLQVSQLTSLVVSQSSCRVCLKLSKLYDVKVCKYVDILSIIRNCVFESLPLHLD